MVEVLDYSAGYPSPAAVKAAGYVGVVRYVGTPGRSKNLTRAEAQAMLAGGVLVGLVYEDSAGWMRAGRPAGVNAARAALQDAANCGVGVRCVYFACDEDVTSQMATVMACLDGAASVLGLARTGVYGEADVIDEALSGKRAAWGWQTRAWSGGRVSSRAHMLQQIGYVTVGGVQCDRNTVLKADWGYWPEGDDMTQEQFDTLTKQVSDVYRLLAYGDAPDAQLGPDGKPVDKGSHRFNVEAILASIQAMRSALGGQLTAQASAITALSTLVSAGANDLTAEDVEAAVATAIRENLVHVDVSVQGQPAAEPNA